jgi:mono/diheme cytochrome c family protein
MKKIIKIILILLAVVIIAFGGVLIYVTTFLPNIDAPEDLQVEMTPENIERGRYLANEVMGCVGCHATRDYTKFAGPIIEETMGAGGEYWGPELNFPGKLYAPNITPVALYNWTDGELFRAITAGVDKDGNALFPIMPYHQYGKLPKEDIYAIIAYLRQMEPREGEFPERELDFPLSIIVNLMPAEGTHNLTPDENDPVKLGEYMVTAGACYDCHTPMEKGRFIEEMAFTGGSEFALPTGGTVRSSNLTPCKETGLGNWTKEMFVKRFRAYSDSSFVPHQVAKGEFNTYMPWEYYSHLKESDLEAMYAYFMSLEPITNKVEKFTP